MGQLIMKLGTNSGYEWKMPKTAAEVIELGTKFTEHEASQLPGSRLIFPTAAQFRDALAKAQEGQAAAQTGEQDRAQWSNVYHNTLIEALPLLNAAYSALLVRYRDTLARLERWGLKTKLGTRGKILVTRPSRETEHAAFLQSYVTQELSLPEAERISDPPLATLQALAETARTANENRVSGQHQRETGVAIRESGSGPLLDLLQLACGALVVTVFDGQITPALQDWGFNIIASPGKTPEPPASEPTPPAA